MKTIKYAAITLALLLVLCGCDTPGSNQGSDPSIKETEAQVSTATVPEDLQRSAPTTQNYSISQKLLAQAEKTLSAHPTLPIYQLKPVNLDENEIYKALSGHKADDTVERSAWDYPDNVGNAVLMRSGQAPYYDDWLDIQWKTNIGTDLYYQSMRSHYVNAVFDPEEDAESQKEITLAFMDKDTAQNALITFLAPYGDVGKLSCCSLSGQALQNLYDRRKSEGSLRVDRCSSGGDVKDTELIAEKAEWTEADDLYFLSASQMISGIPYFGSEIHAWLDGQGWVQLSISSFAAADEASDTKPLAELTAILSSIDSITADFYSEKTNVFELELYYYGMPDGSCRPLWHVKMDYEFYNPVSRATELRLAAFWLDAYTAVEVTMDGDGE